MFRTQSIAATLPVLAVSLVVALAAGGCRARYGGYEYDAVTCSNGFDDNGNGLADCDDPGCAAFCGPGSDAAGFDSGLPGNDSGTSPYCGDGLVNRAPEECDGSDLDGETCITLGHDAGVLTCSSSCLFDDKGCTDTTASCGNGACEPGETCTTCPTDCCGVTCGDGVCSAGETCSSCSIDCPCTGTCGDFSCSGSETCSTCPTDCGTCGGVCGDLTCSATETCTSCPTDCGSCTTGSCVGMCGSFTGTCYCDSACVGAGDCCFDACSACGYC